MVDRIAIDWRTAGLDEATEALVRFGAKLTSDPGSMTADDVAELKSHGYDDAAVSSCVQVVAYFNYINRIAEGLGVEDEDWLDADGRLKGETPV